MPTYLLPWKKLFFIDLQNACIIISLAIIVIFLYWDKTRDKHFVDIHINILNCSWKYNSEYRILCFVNNHWTQNFFYLNTFRNFPKSFKANYRYGIFTTNNILIQVIITTVTKSALPKKNVTLLYIQPKYNSDIH